MTSAFHAYHSLAVIKKEKKYFQKILFKAMTLSSRSQQTISASKLELCWPTESSLLSVTSFHTPPCRSTRTTTQFYATVQCILWLYYWSLQVSKCWQYHKKHYKVTLQNELKYQVFISWLGTGKCHPCQLIHDELLLQILEDSRCKTCVSLHFLY